MTSGFFKSTTALAVMVSLAAPLPGLAQGQGGKQINLGQMTEAEIGDLVDRCRKQAENRERKLAKGEEPEQKNGKIAKFCAAYGAGEFDAQLPAGLQSATVLASVQEIAAQAGAGAQTGGQQAEAEAEVEVEAEQQAEAQPKPAEAQAAEQQAEAQAKAAEQQAEAAAKAAEQQAEAAAKAAEQQAEAQQKAAEQQAEAAAKAAEQQAEAQQKAAEQQAEAAAKAAEQQAEAQQKAAEQQAEAEQKAAEQQAEAAQAAAEAEAEAVKKQLTEALEQQESDAAAAAEAAAAEQQAEAAAETDAAAEAGSGEAEAIAQDLAQSQQAPAAEETDNPELKELDSQAQADAVAEAETSAAIAAAAAAEAGAESAEAEVVEETVTEETARSSDEEFETKVGENVQPQSQQQMAAAEETAAAPADDDDGGLSDGQRAVLLGLGALAVGQLLNSGERVVTNTGDRAVVEQDGQFRVIKNDDALLRQPGSNVTTYKFKDGSTRTVVVRENGVEVETIRAADGRVLRRTKILPDGRSVVLFDDTQEAEKVVVNELPQVSDAQRGTAGTRAFSAEDLASALAAQQGTEVDRRFSLSQIRNIDAVRRLVPEINVDSVNFETGSAVIRPQEAEELAALGNALRSLIAENPSEVFLIEGHTDAVGAATYNLALSDRRAETVALALTEYFDVPPENMVVQGYGESDLMVKTLDAERANRRVAVRRITPLLMASGN